MIFLAYHILAYGGMFYIIGMGSGPFTHIGWFVLCGSIGTTFIFHLVFFHIRYKVYVWTDIKMGIVKR
eukprot:UN08153